MGAPADRLNRIVVFLLGLLCLAAGVVIFVRSFGGFGDDRAQAPLITERTSSFVDRNDVWFWWVVAAVALLLALLALRWLLAQLRTDRMGHVDLESDPRRGATTLHSGAVTNAVCEEIESYRGVRSAKARLLDAKRQPDLVIEVALDGRADIAATRARIENEAIAHTRQAMDRPDLSVQLTLRPATG